MATLHAPVGSRDHISGKTSATITLVEYADFESPECGHAYRLVKQLMKELNHEIQFVFRHFPSTSNPDSMAAAEATEAADLQNKFWEMHDLIFEQQDQFEQSNLPYFAETLDLNLEKFEHDLSNVNITSKIESDIESGIRSGVTKVPSFFINDEYLEDYDGTLESLTEAIEKVEEE